LRKFLRRAEIGGPELLDQEQASAPVDSGVLNISPPMFLWIIIIIISVSVAGIIPLFC
jgi:hypothetical protein